MLLEVFQWKMQKMVNLVESGEKCSELAQDAKLIKKQIIYPGCVQKVQCKLKDLNFSNSFEKIVLFSPLEEFYVESELVIFETTEKLKKRTKFIDVVIYNPTSCEIVINAGTVLGVVSDVAAAFPLPCILREKENCQINEINVDKGKDPEVKFDLKHLLSDEKDIALKMLMEEMDVFSKTKNDIGHIKDFKLKIELTDNIPVTEAYRRIPRLLYDEVKNHVSNLLANGWIRQSFSSYSSPMVCVRKKDGGLRLCIDFRKLNLKTIPDKQPIPRIQDILDGLGGNSWFTTLDMSQAYHQGEIHEDSQKFTAFSTPWSLYEWVRIPYGIKNAPPGFQRFINGCLANLVLYDKTM